MVDDGSKDGTADYALTRYGCPPATGKASGAVRVLKLARNNGKGGAVRKGMCRTRGSFLLMADADGATKAADLTAVLAATRKLAGVGGTALGAGIGSRAHLEAAGGGDAKAVRSPLRRFLMWGFHTFIQLMLGGSGIEDTQCGFKLFSRPAARLLFPVQHIDRWAFDVELVFLANRLKVPMVEVPVNWAEVDGSKIDLSSDALKMARDITAIRIAYALGVWKDRAPAGIKTE